MTAARTAGWAASCVDAFIHAAVVPGDRLGRRRASTFSAPVVRIGDLGDALQEAFPQSAGTIAYAEDAELQEQFAGQPPLATTTADALGAFRHDGSPPALIERAMEVLPKPDKALKSPAASRRPVW